MDGVERAEMTATVSVVIPTYNRAALLAKAVESVLAQSVLPDEVVIVDDGSTDETHELCAQWPSPVRYVYQQNAGVSAARNRGINEARGRYIAFLDSDDVWRTEKLAAQLAVMRALPSVGWCTTGHEIIDLTGQPRFDSDGFSSGFPLFRNLRITPEDFFGSGLQRTHVNAKGVSHTVYWGDSYQLNFYGNFTYPSALLIDRRVIDEAGVFDESLRVAEDTEYCHRLAAAAPIAVIMTPLIGHRVDQYGSLVAPENVVTLVETALLSVERASGLRRQLSVSESAARRKGRQMLLNRLAYAHLASLNPAGARKRAREAWQEGPGRSPRALAIWAASFLPASGLKLLHKLKRSLRRPTGHRG